MCLLLPLVQLQPLIEQLEAAFNFIPVGGQVAMWLHRMEYMQKGAGHANFFKKHYLGKFIPSTGTTKTIKNIKK